MKAEPQWSRGSPQGFTLLEVLVAMALFFLAAFSLMELTSRSLRAARSLQQSGPSVGSLAAEFLSSTNTIETGTESGSFDEPYRGYGWSRDVTEAATNGLYQVDFWISRGGRASGDPALSIFVYRQDPLGVVGLRPRSGGLR